MEWTNFRLQTDGRKYLQDGGSGIPNGNFPFQIYGVNSRE